MTLSYYPEELPYVPDEWPAAAPQALFAAPRRRPDAMTLAGAFLLAFLLLQVMLDRSSSLPAAAASGADAAVPALELAPAQPESAAAPPENSAAPLPPEAGPLPQKVEVASPYDSYTLTQGPHGFSYGHMAVDLHAGEGEVIRSPIDGAVTARYVDQWGNPALVVENERHQITLLHGDYIVEVGQVLAQGDPLGYESNQGYTKNWAGELCHGRAGCGFHTHLNIFDKGLGQNVNPLEVLDR
jgi:murein DD-endopeptidase MepM/ murein hydrolase activator NlpD